MSILNPVQLKFNSRPFSRRAGLMPMAIAIVVGWIFVALWLAVAVYAASHNAYWSTTLIASTLAFAAFLGYMSFTLIHDACKEYIFELTESEAVLFVVDKLLKKEHTDIVLLDDIKYAEYYPYTDSACVILHAPYKEMEVPLWPLGEHGADVIDYLGGRGIKVVNVQSDDPIPE